MIEYVTDIPNQFQKAHEADAGYDIVANENFVLNGNTRELISTGLYVSIPEGYVGIIKSRSGLSTNHSIDIGAGVVDSGYTGEVKVCFINSGPEEFPISIGDKIAQMVIVPICTMQATKVQNLQDSERGDNGFNSTGY